jgi:CheY-like chemotaxis protein
MQTKHKILLVDDDPDLLDLYQQVLKDLPSQPEIAIANSGARALALLESDTYRLLITDLKMPRMDGLQVLSIVRRKHPQLRTVVLTSVQDEQFRSRVYALGVDQFWQKPGTEREVAMFKDCIESLMEREEMPGFRGVQSKSLVDIIQLECLSQSSSVLRITNGPLVGRIWINQGELFDAEAGNLEGEEAFQHILSWKNGCFEILPAEPDHPHTIKTSYNAMLLESAQAIDEALSDSAGHSRRRSDPLAQLDGLEFFIALRMGDLKPAEVRGVENPERLTAWSHNTLERFRALGDRLQAGQPDTVAGLGLHRHLGLACQNGTEFCISWQHHLTATQVRQSTKKAAALWAS